MFQQGGSNDGSNDAYGANRATGMHTAGQSASTANSATAAAAAAAASAAAAAGGNYASMPMMLPHGWQTAYTAAGELYYIDHNTRTTHWQIPAEVLQQQYEQQAGSHGGLAGMGGPMNGYAHAGAAYGAGGAHMAGMHMQAAHGVAGPHAPLMPSHHLMGAGVMHGGYRNARPRRGIDRTKLKTKMCMNIENGGKCSWGDNCAFAHSSEELSSHPHYNAAMAASANAAGAANNSNGYNNTNNAAQRYNNGNVVPRGGYRNAAANATSNNSNNNSNKPIDNNGSKPVDSNNAAAATAAPVTANGNSDATASAAPAAAATSNSNSSNNNNNDNNSDSKGNKTSDAPAVSSTPAKSSTV